MKRSNIEMLSMKAIWIILAVIIIGIAFSVEGTANLSAPGTSEKVIVTEIYYDTYLKGDTDGEFIRIHNPTESSIHIGEWQITDGEGVITFPSWANIDAGGSLYLAYNATAFYDEMLQNADFEYGVDSDPTPNMIDTYGDVKLANTGDEVILKDEKGEIIDVVIYGNSVYAGAGWSGTPVKDVDEGVILERDRNETTAQYEDTNTSADWDDNRVYVVGQSHFPYETFSFDGNVTVFTSPDSSFIEIANAIDNAQESIYLNVYQFHNFCLMDHIIEAIKRGVEVRIMLEGDPVNGIADEEKYIANQTVTAGGEVRFMIDDEDRGIHDRYAFNHAKYALIDNETTIVMSENWKNTGVPTNNTFGNRGWGVIINNPNVTNYFSRVFFEDWKPASKDSFPFTSDDPIYGNKYGCPPPDFVSNRTIPTGNYSHPFNSEIISGEFNVSPVLAPDTSLMQTKSIIGMIKGAKKSVYVEQLYIYKNWGTYADPKPNPFLEAAINASRRGCEVKILLDSKYGKEHNEETIEYVNDIAADEGLNLDARLIDNEAIGLNKTHNKGVIVDRSKVLISSVNWNEYSPRNNREAGLIIQNEAVAEFYTDVFLYDWYNGTLPPVANFTYSPAHPVVNQTIIFNASSSYDPDGNITKYEWEFGDENETKWNKVNSWLYQLQNIDIDAIANTTFDLIVIDYSSDGSEEGEFTKEQINNLKNRGKIVIAYMSIGEAENYRYYWNSSWDADDDGIPDVGAPSWLDMENPEWEGNYKVRYWQPGWQDIIFCSPDSYLDKIIAAGFDGVYLDVIDAYEYYAEQGRDTAEQEMVDFVKTISNYAKGRSESFGIFPQNGEALAKHHDYIAACTGIGKEDTWYDDDIPQDETYTEEVLKNLDLFKKRDELVLVVNYCRNQTNIDDFYAEALKKGYVPYATVRDLDALVVNPRHAPGEVVSHSYSSAGDYIVNLTVTDNKGTKNTASKIITVSVSPAKAVFDTGPGTYPSISGTHNGTIKPNQTITVSKLYTYPCVGTGGHTEYARIWNSTWDGAEAHWNGYIEDWHNITFNKTFTLFANETYNFTIRTGSYPQIIHEPSFNATGGKITCTNFTDANGVIHYGWIPAIRLE